MTQTKAVNAKLDDPVVWEDPPRVKTSIGGPISQRRQAMLENPGRWLLWADNAYPSVGAPLRKAGFQVTCRRIPGDPVKVKVYARWPRAKARAAAAKASA